VSPNRAGRKGQQGRLANVLEELSMRRVFQPGGTTSSFYVVRGCQGDTRVKGALASSAFTAVWVNIAVGRWPLIPPAMPATLRHLHSTAAHRCPRLHQHRPLPQHWARQGGGLHSYWACERSRAQGRHRYWRTKCRPPRRCLLPGHRPNPANNTHAPQSTTWFCNELSLSVARIQTITWTL
jgi:hypothetical protein